MRTFRLALLGTALIAATAGTMPVMAASVADSASPSWTGPFLGLQGGMAGARIINTEDAVPGISEKVVYQFSDERSTYSLHAGFDQEFGDRYVWGVELAAGWLGFDIDPLSSGGFGSPFSADYDLSLSGRVGILTSPDTLLYARAGLSLVNTAAETGFSSTAHQLLPAALFGVGVESYITGSLSARVEANYTLPVTAMAIPADFKSFDPHYLKVTGGFVWHLDAEKGTERKLAEPAVEAFDGAYVGAIAGYNLGQMVVPVVTAGATVGPFGAETPSGGVMAGYDARLDDLVVGAEASIVNMNARFFDPAQNSPLQGSTKLFGIVNNVGMVSGRVGFLANPSTLFYAKAGAGFIETTANPKFFTFDSGGTRWLAGHQFGAGVEAMLTDNVALRLEGLYTKADQGFAVDLTQAGQAELFPSIVTANLGLSWHF